MNTNYNEQVVLLRAGEHPQSMPLAEAVRHVMAISDSEVQLQALISRDGQPVMTLAEIRQVYEEPEFPKT